MKDNKIKVAYFGAGCFWHVEYLFSELYGVNGTKVGFMGGNLKNPSYEEVCSDKTGHAEVVKVEYDSEKLNYERLLEIFWKNHNPTELNRQGLDIGTQYRSVIFYTNEEQKKIAEESKEKVQEKYEKKIVTEIVKASNFYEAEEYHQKYYQKRGQTCKIY